MTGLGIGPGAEGRFDTDEAGRMMTRAHITGLLTISRLRRDKGSGWMTGDPLSDRDNANERLIMGLRSDLGVDVRTLEDLYGTPLPA